MVLPTRRCLLDLAGPAALPSRRPLLPAPLAAQHPSPTAAAPAAPAAAACRPARRHPSLHARRRHRLRVHPPERPLPQAPAALHPPHPAPPPPRRRSRFPGWRRRRRRSWTPPVPARAPPARRRRWRRSGGRRPRRSTGLGGRRGTEKPVGRRARCRLGGSVQGPGEVHPAISCQGAMLPRPLISHPHHNSTPSRRNATSPAPHNPAGSALPAAPHVCCHAALLQRCWMNERGMG